MLKNIILHINPEIVRWLILKSKEFSVKEDVTFDEKIPDSEYEYDASQILAEHPDDLTYEEIQCTINDLEKDQKIELLALYFLGRGDFEEWKEACREAKIRLTNDLTSDLLSKPLLASYLERALNILGYDVDPDQILD